MSGLSDRSPFVGPRPIQVGEALYGRKTEIRELHELLQARRIVVLHSPSGAGKSSLVQAGLIPRLRAGRFFDVWRPIRVNLDPSSFDGLPEWDASMLSNPRTINRYLLSAMVSLEDELPEARRRSPAELSELDFRTYLDTRPRRKSRAKDSVVLLFDQFEEVLSVAPRDVEAKEEFFTQVGAALDGGDYWALFIIREDYLAALTPYRDRIPTQLTNTYRLDLLGLEGAREAATRLAEQGGRTFPAVNKLVRDLSTVQVQQPDGTFAVEQGLHIEPVHLQVVCRRLWEAMPEGDLSIDEEDIEAYAGISSSLAGYYADAVSDIAAGDLALERALRDWVGTKLIVGGIRSQVRREAGRSAGLDNEHIQRLLDYYLVRVEQRAGASWFELGHDRLVEPILVDNEAWRGGHLHPVQIQAKLWDERGRGQGMLLRADALPDALAWAEANPGLLTPAEREFLDHSRTLREQEARANRRRRSFMIALATLALVALAAGLSAAWLAWEARHERNEARTAQAEAEAARNVAETAKARSVADQAEAEDARAEAEAARLQAQRALKANERLARDVLRQMFQVALRRFIDGIDKRDVSGVVEVDERWTPLLERGEQRFAAANIVEGGGRIIVAGNDELVAESLFVEISGEWLLGDQARREVAVLTHEAGRYSRLEKLRRTLSSNGYVHHIDPALETLIADDSDIGLLIVDNRWETEFGSDEIAAVEAFVRAGGGLLAVGDGREWLEAEPGAYAPTPTLANYPMNQLLAPFGARWIDAALEAELLEVHADKAGVEFDNELDHAVDIYSRKPAGRDEYFMTLSAGEIRDVRTSIGAVWVVREAESDGGGEVPLGEATIVYERQIVTIGQTVRSRKAPARTRDKRPDPGGDGDGGGDVLPRTLSNAAMQAGKKAIVQAARACGKTHGSLSPMVKVRFTVGPDGSVSEAKALPPMKGTLVGTCVVNAVSSQRFPRSKDGVVKTWTLPL